MKKVYFPLAIAIIAMLVTTGCIKNQESAGVKAIRTAQAGLLTAQATAATTAANAQATLLAAQAAVQSAQAALLTAEIAVTNAEAEAAVLQNAATTESNRHAAAVNALNEQLQAATTAEQIAALNNKLAEENATSANTLLALANQKASLEAAAAQQKIDAQLALAQAQLNLAKQQMLNAQQMAKAQQQNTEFMAQLKVSNLTSLAADYNTAFSNYSNTQMEINTKTVALITMQSAVATAQKDIADSTDVQNQRTVVAAAVAAVSGANDALATATTNDNAAKGIVAQLKLAVAGTPLNTILADNQKKIDAETVLSANLTSTKLKDLATLNDADFQMAWNTANNAVSSALSAKAIVDTKLAAAILKLNPDTLAIKAAQAAKTVDSLALYVTKSESFTNTYTSKTYSVTVAALPDSIIAVYVTGGVWDNLSYKTAYNTAKANFDTQYKTYTDAATALTKAQSDLSKDVAAVAAAQAKVDAAKAALVTAKAAFKVQNDLMTKYQAAVDKDIAALTASSTRLSNYNAFATQLSGWIAVDPTTQAQKTALAKAELVQDNIAPTALGTKQVLAAAKSSLAAANVNLKTQQSQLASVITSYTTNLPLAQNNVAWMNTQIQNYTDAIANLNSILAQQKAIVDMWIAKIKLALS